MADSLTYEKVLELIKETNRLSSERLEKEFRESNKKFEEKLEKGFEKSRVKTDEELLKSRKEFEEKLEEGFEKSRIKTDEELFKSRREFEKKLEEGFEKSRIKLDTDMLKSRREFDKKIGEITGTLGRFVEGLVKPKLLEMFRKKGIMVTEILPNVEIHDKNGQKLAEIDLLLLNSLYSIAVEVKTTLTVAGVNEHLRRLAILQNKPNRFLKGTTLLGAVAGMVVRQDADIYAYKKGLYVLKQKGEILEIANDDAFKPREWVIE